MNYYFINKTIIFFICFVVTVSRSSFATESIFCENEEYTLVIFFNIDRSFADFQLYINGQLEDTKGMNVEKIIIDFKKRNIELIVKSPHLLKRMIQLNVKGDVGVLYISDKDYKVFCDWSAFEDL